MKNGSLKNTHNKLYGILIILMSCLFLFYKYIATVSHSVMLHELMMHFQIDAKSLAQLVTIYSPS